MKSAQQKVVDASKEENQETIKRVDQEAKDFEAKQAKVDELNKQIEETKRYLKSNDFEDTKQATSE